MTAVGRLSETVQQLHSNLAHLLPQGAHLAERVPAPDNRRDPSPVPSETPKSALSPQEIRVLQLTSRGFSNRQIARELALSEQTVKNYMSTVFRKIGVQSRTEAAYYWTRKGGQDPTECP
ncbi:response regulator transcription factor [Streptomyces enissocaesilis]|uniref:response regulator transcription factor n=1 Tax=Streptomyces enissocaesilis TaxID=332589 RepID=UPI0031CEDF96